MKEEKKHTSKAIAPISKSVAIINRYGEEISVDEKYDLLYRLKENGVVGEVLVLLDDLWEATYKVGEFIVNIGRAIFRVIKLVIEKYPGALFGIVLAAVLDTFLWGGLSAIPVIGGLITKILNALAVVVGTIVGLKNNDTFKEIVSFIKDVFNELFSAIRQTAQLEVVR